MNDEKKTAQIKWEIVWKTLCAKTQNTQTRDTTSSGESERVLRGRQSFQRHVDCFRYHTLRLLNSRQREGDRTLWVSEHKFASSLLRYQAYLFFHGKRDDMACCWSYLLCDLICSQLYLSRWLGTILTPWSIAERLARLFLHFFFGETIVTL